MDTKHHCNSCPHWYVTQKQYPSGFYDITICRKYGKQIYYLAGDKNRTPYPCSICEKEFSYVPYMEQELLQEVEKMTERLTEKITNKETGEVLLYRLKGQWGGVGDNRMRSAKKLGELEDAEEDGRLVILPKCNIGDTVYLPIDFQNKIYTGTVDGFEYSPRRNKWVVKIITDDGEKCYEAFDDFGKTFFLDIEDAARALKEMTKGEMTY